jgi:exopolyphosphatase/pppGpp-phosphohydrolase
MCRASALIGMLLSTLACSAAPETPMRMCAIDMGSNSFRRIVGRFDGAYRESAIEVRRLGVGDDLAKHGRISDAKLEDIRHTLREFHAACTAEGASPVVAIGTAAFRDAPNGSDVVKLAADVGVRMEIATEARESQLAYLVGTLGAPGAAVIDNGSRSIELVADEEGTLRHHVFTLGYRVAFDRFFAAAQAPAVAIAGFRAELAKEAAQAPFMRGKKKLVGIEFAEMVSVLFDGGEIEGRVLTRSQLLQRVSEIEGMTAAEFARLKAREDIDRALPRLVALEFLARAFDYSEVELTRRELGTGLIIEAGQAQASRPGR